MFLVDYSPIHTKKFQVTGLGLPFLYRKEVFFYIFKILQSQPFYDYKILSALYEVLVSLLRLLDRATAFIYYKLENKQILFLILSEVINGFHN